MNKAPIRLACLLSPLSVYSALRAIFGTSPSIHLAAVDPRAPPHPSADPAAGWWGNPSSRCVYSVGLGRDPAGGAMETVVPKDLDVISVFFGVFASAC